MAASDATKNFYTELLLRIVMRSSLAVVGIWQWDDDNKVRDKSMEGKLHPTHTHSRLYFI